MIPTPLRGASLLLIGSSLILSGCQTSQGGPTRESFMGGMREQTAKSRTDQGKSAQAPAQAPRRTTEEPSAARSEPHRPMSNQPARSAPIPDTRVMLYQPKGDLLLILVNEGNSGRDSEEGRTRLALGESNRAYKVLSDSQMTALLQSLGAGGYDMNAEEFVKGDEQYLGKAAGDLPRYQGIISVERGEAKTKVLGFRKSSESDALGAKRYQSYVSLKALVQKWFGDTSRSEYPIGGVVVPAPKGGK
jgi:hypothetical protein